jgi:hypothetical protein
MKHHLYPREDGYADIPLYPYNPSETAAYAFLAMFGIAGLLHLVLMFPYRAWFPIPMIIGSASKTQETEIIQVIRLTISNSGSGLLLPPLEIPRQHSPNTPFHPVDTPHYGCSSNACSNHLHVSQTYRHCS